MRFESPWFLLLLVPVGVIVAVGLRRQRRMPPALLFPSIREAKALGRSFRAAWVDLPRMIQGAAALLAVVALARPQLPEADVMAGEGADYAIALDMSGSMNAVDRQADEILEWHRKGQEPPNRFETARMVLREFIRDRVGDRVAMVIFSSKAWVKFPLTMDRDAMLRILDSLVLDDRTRGGAGQETCTNGCTITGEATAIGDALARAYRRLEESPAKSRNIILITDGDNNAGKADPLEVARFIAQQSPDRPVRVWTFLVGTGRETWLPAIHEFTGRPLRTPEGLRVYERPDQPFPVNPDLLRSIAEATGGKAFESASAEEFRKAFEDLERTEFTSVPLRQWRDVFLWPLALAMALLGLGEALGLTVWRRWP